VSAKAAQRVGEIPSCGAHRPVASSPCVRGTKSTNGCLFTGRRRKAVWRKFDNATQVVRPLDTTEAPGDPGHLSRSSDEGKDAKPTVYRTATNWRGVRQRMRPPRVKRCEIRGGFFVGQTWHCLDGCPRPLEQPHYSSDRLRPRPLVVIAIGFIPLLAAASSAACAAACPQEPTRSRLQLGTPCALAQPIPRDRSSPPTLIACR
jgi:hypothetical protein